MKTEIELNDVGLAYLNELANEYKTTPSEIVFGLLLGFSLSSLDKSEKPPKKRFKRHISFDATRNKRFAKRYSNSFDYLSLYGQKKYTNEETD